MPSKAFNVFNGKKKQEIMEISDIFLQLNKRKGPNTKYSLLNGALVLLISSWEVYCEDICKEVADSIQNRSSLTFLQLDKKLQKDLIQYAGHQFKGNQDPLKEKIALLPDGGWRKLLVERLNEYTPDFNTPKFSRQRGKDLNGLFRQVLGIKMSVAIENFLEDDGLCGRLDGVVTLRGEIAHTGEAQGEDRLSTEILGQHVRSFIKAAAAVDVIIYQEFQEKLGFTPWNITQQLREALPHVALKKL